VTVFATLRNQDDMSLLPCEFNPSSVKLTKSATWSTPPARNAKAHPRPQFVGTGPQTLNLSLLFNAYGRDCSIGRSRRSGLRMRTTPRRRRSSSTGARRSP